MYIREPLNKFSTYNIKFTKITKYYPEFDKNKGVKEYIEENLK